MAQSALVIQFCLVLLVYLGPALLGVISYARGPSVADAAYVFLSDLATWLLVLSVLAIPLAFVRPLRGAIGLFYMFCSVAGVCLVSALALNVLGFRWGAGAFLLGVTGPGVIPLALVAALFPKAWADLIYLLICCAVAFGWYIGGIALVASVAAPEKAI